MKRLLSVFLAGMMVLSFSCATFAQEEKASAEKENVEYSYGTVIKVDDAAKQITVSEYDWDNDAETNVAYSVDPAVEFENTASLKDIKPNSYVDIEYIKGEAGKRIAKFISVYEAEADTEETE
jgi:Cu/Ag efflux protein CusF